MAGQSENYRRFTPLHPAVQCHCAPCLPLLTSSACVWRRRKKPLFKEVVKTRIRGMKTRILSGKTAVSGHEGLGSEQLWECKMPGSRRRRAGCRHDSGGAGGWGRGAAHASPNVRHCQRDALRVSVLAMHLERNTRSDVGGGTSCVG